MTKKEYLEPTMEIIEADVEQEILVGSVTNITTEGLEEMGLDEEEDGLVLPGTGMPTTGSIWDDAF